jgi:hypothetical protein
MKLFLVRQAGTTKVQGLFWAHTPAGLRHAVEEMAKPDRFEWAEITRLGGVWRSGDPREALDVPDCRDFPLSRAGEAAFGEAFDRAFDFGFADFGERLLEMIASQDAHRWTRFDAEQEDAPAVPALQEQRMA